MEHWRIVLLLWVLAVWWFGFWLCLFGVFMEYVCVGFCLCFSYILITFLATSLLCAGRTNSASQLGSNFTLKSGGSSSELFFWSNFCHWLFTSEVLLYQMQDGQALTPCAIGGELSFSAGQSLDCVCVAGKESVGLLVQGFYRKNNIKNKQNPPKPNPK